MKATGVTLLAAAMFAATGCAAGTQASKGSAETPKTTPLAKKPVELTLRTAGGRMMFVGDLRGKPVLLFIFATFDGVSQAALRPLGRFVRAHGDVYVIGVAIEPDAAELIDPYARALSPPFPITCDPDGHLEQGDTPIGPVESVPTYVMLDALGRPVSRHLGFASENALDRMLYLAKRAVTPEQAARARKPPPLLGNPITN